MHVSRPSKTFCDNQFAKNNSRKFFLDEMITKNQISSNRYSEKNFSKKFLIELLELEMCLEAAKTQNSDMDF